jgi:hypothetical protein
MLRQFAWIIPLTLLASCGVQAEPIQDALNDDFEITLQRTACFGSCPDYTVSIDGSGHIEFRSRAENFPGEAEVHRAFSISDGVLVPGAHTDQIDPEIVRSLVRQFHDADFFELEDEYRALITDNPTYILTINTGTKSKTVIDYVGREVGMPESVTQLQDAVDLAAGSARWIDGAAGLVEWLEARAFDFTSDEARKIVLEGAFYDAADETIIEMIDRGADLDALTAHPWGRDDVVLGKGLLETSIRRGRTELFLYLADAGWVERSEKRVLESIFADKAAGCSASMVRAFARQGLEIDALGEEGQPALAALSSIYLCNRDDEGLVDTARALLELGADPNQRDINGETAIYGVEYLPLLDLLYSHGAEGNVLDKQGISPALSSWTDEIVLRHLQEGARPLGTYFDGRTLREQMKYRPMPMVEQWLRDNPSSEHGQDSDEP